MGCVNDELSPDCIKGRVLGYDRCNQVSLIQILSGDLNGGSISLFGREFDNVVLFPHDIERYSFSNLEFREEVEEQESIILFKYRYFDPEKDKWPDSDVVCLRNVGPHNLPTIVITSYSNSNCPSDHDK